MKKKINGFTLIELLVIIAIIGIITLSASKMNFNAQTSNQNSLMFSNSIGNNIDSIRNNELLGKGVKVGGKIVYPSKWSIHFDSTSGGHINAYYTTGGSLIPYNDFKINNSGNIGVIKSLKCYNSRLSSFDSKTSIDIEISGGNISFSGCTNSTKNAILEVVTIHGSIYRSIFINRLTGLTKRL